MNGIKIDKVSLMIKKDTILDNISINFEEGKIYGLVGRNGSGKTMLMKCICGFVKATEGTIKVYDKIIGKDCDFPDDIGVIIENPGFIPYFNGFKNLKLLARLNDKISNEDIKKYMMKVGLDPNLKRTVGKYSLGMKQRLALAQAIMENPKILILDEPMNGLDKSGVEEIRNYLSSLKGEGKIIILASHTDDDIRVLCDSVYEIEKGSLINQYEVVSL